ncbi:hypothetical protein DF182_21105 [Chitinophaga flava]|uniref:Uncharacterized protein n=1 Tax=Chitinophaga flava TaxID=2259036 RepID=A0A365XRQ9_9BACT|nr:hypothetical protein DF182_21105 [Chitinophaga flava]
MDHDTYRALPRDPKHPPPLRKRILQFSTSTKADTLMKDIDSNSIGSVKVLQKGCNSPKTVISEYKNKDAKD